MTKWKKNLFGGIAAIFFGFSCCWISALAIWLGGTTLLGGLAVYMEDFQIPLIILGVVLIAIATISYSKKIFNKSKHEYK